MISSVIPARLEFSCGHAPLVSLPRLKGETVAQRTERVSQAKAEARCRACDFCGPADQAAQAVLEVRPVEAAAPAGELNGHHRAGDEKENLMHSVETPSVTRLGAEETRRTFPPRRRLNEEQEREVTRLYAETMLPVPDISKQFSIGESSVYRIAARHGAGLRGRTGATSNSSAAATSTPALARTRRTRTTTAKAAPVIAKTVAAAPVAPPATGARRTRAAAGARRTRAAAAQPTPTPPTTRRRRTSVVAAPAAPAAKTTRRGRRPSVGLLRFEIQYRAEAVVRAADVSAALRQVELLGATDVLAIVRQDR